MTNAKTVIIGEPEFAILDICNGKKYDEINGISYKKEGKIIKNPKQKSLDINKLPLPSLNLLPMKKYYYEILGDNFTLFEGSRGCPFSCSFCFKSMYDNSYRIKRSDKLISEVKYAIEKFNIKNGYFIDLEFCINRDLVEKLCNFLIRKNYDFNWTCQTRFDTIDYDLLIKMKKAGCKIIHFGVESGSQRILDKTKKQITINHIKKKMQLLKKLNIKTVCFFMFGIPTETDEEMKKTIDFAKKLNPTYASFHVAVSYEKTDLFKETEKNCKKVGVFLVKCMDDEKFKKLKRKAYISFYIRPSYIFNRLLQGDFRLIIKQMKLFFKYINVGKK